jgi:mono/diheme cytochrome c family protein
LYDQASLEVENMKKMKTAFVILLVVMVAFLMAACGGKDKTKTGAAVSLTGDAEAGRAVFIKSCVVCHGVEGGGGVPNAGSKDATIPELKPIDEGFSSVASMDKVMEHGALPEGDSVAKKMPAFGDDGTLTPQQIADVIAYVRSINNLKE